ncbi:PREDICTED: translation initiation factor IF-2-like [Rhinopithecus bieti]|uniref:translation initiation factor IF-2-like n=1 Tax=Rhinopithecus bieti TaxID=61621 RepID=UPI00083C0B2B|nr:PREDICTED: translation initiation factor IF-2-like [Rhinopithecus bieti]
MGPCGEALAGSPQPPAARPPARGRPRRAATSQGACPEPEAQRAAEPGGVAAEGRFRLAAVGDPGRGRTSVWAGLRIGGEGRSEVGAPHAPRSARLGRDGGGGFAGTAIGRAAGLADLAAASRPEPQYAHGRTGAHPAARPRRPGPEQQWESGLAFPLCVLWKSASVGEDSGRGIHEMLCSLLFSLLSPGLEEHGPPQERASASLDSRLLLRAEPGEPEARVPRASKIFGFKLVSC